MVGTTGGDEHWFAVVSLNDRLSAIDVPPRRINEIVHGKRGISADTALRLSRALGLSDMFFINMQAHYYAEIAREQLATELATIQRIA